MILNMDCCQIGQIFLHNRANLNHARLEKQALGGKSALSDNTVSRAAGSQTETRHPLAHMRLLSLLAW